MQKMYMFILLSNMLYVSSSFSMEQSLQSLDQFSYGIDTQMFQEFRYADDHTEFINKNPHIINAWVQPPQSYSHKSSYTVLHLMVECDNISAAKALLQAGADSNIATQYEKYTPLHMACSKEMAELLLKHRAQLESKNKKGKTSLYCVLFNRDVSYSGYFCRLNHELQMYHEKCNELAKYLLEQGANSDAVGKNGESLLHRSIGGKGSWCWSYPQYITLLMKFSADIEIKDCNGNTPYDLAIERLARCKEILKVLKEYNIFFVSDESIRDIRWCDEKHEYHFCKARNFFELLKDGAQELKRCMNEDSKRYWENDIKKMLTDLLGMARKNDRLDALKRKRKAITYYTDRGYLFNKVNTADLEKWIGKDSIEYIDAFCKNG